MIWEGHWKREGSFQNLNSHGSETWCVNVEGEHMVKVFENNILRRFVHPRRIKIRGMNVLKWGISQFVPFVYCSDCYYI